jgi:hypothetical protein
MRKDLPAIKPTYSLRKTRRFHCLLTDLPPEAAPGQLLCFGFGYHIGVNRFRGFLVRPRLIAGQSGSKAIFIHDAD